MRQQDGRQERDSPAPAKIHKASTTDDFITRSNEGNMESDRTIPKLNVAIIDCSMMERMEMHDNNSPVRAEDFMEYTPTRLLDTLIETLQLRNDSQLCRLLEVAPPVISKIRNSRMSVGASMLIRMHEVSGISIADLRYLMGDRREKFRFTHPQSRFTADS